MPLIAESHSVGGTPFGRLPSLTRQIRELIHDYPEGIGIIKELVQNADDAGARVVHLVADHRSHPSCSLPSPSMAALQGPALLAYNDRPFTAADFDGIQEIYRSGKVQAAEKTGQFGKGFNTVYNVTDWPGFVTADRVAFFDPHCTVLPNATLHNPGRSWTLKDCWRRFPDLLRPFAAGGLTEGTTDFPGTIFRLPFRTAEQAGRSDITGKPFEKTNLEELFRELGAVREELLLFLKSVEEIRYSEVSRDDSRRELLSIETVNADEVRSARARLLAAMAGNPADVVRKLVGRPPVCESYRHTFTVRAADSSGDGSGGASVEAEWRVVAGLGVDKGGEVAAAVEEITDRKVKVIPLAGAAARLRVDGDVPPTRLSGRVYCSLPLPAETGFPVHLNGFFDLDSSRHALTTGSVTGNARVRVRWNELLVEHVLAPLYGRLLQDLTLDIGDTHPDAYYDLWPDAQGTPPKPFKALPARVYAALAPQAVVRAHSAKRWVPVANVWVLPPAAHALAPPLAAARVVLPDPALRPEHANALERAGAKVNRFTPKVARDWLQKTAKFVLKPADAPHASLKRPEWVESLLCFCLSDGNTDLTGLPLALTTDGHLRPFGPGPQDEPLYLAGEDERYIFAGQAAWFLDPEVANRCGIAARKIGGVERMTPAHVLARLAHVLTADKGIRLSPERSGFASAAWLRRICTYLSQAAGAGHTFAPEAFQKVALVPDQNGLLQTPGNCETPLLPRGADPDVVEALRTFGVPMVTGPATLTAALGALADAIDSLIWPLTGPDVADSLHGMDEFPPFDPALYRRLVEFLADARWKTGDKTYDQVQIERLQAAPVFPLLQGGATALTADVYVKGDFPLPSMAAGVALVDPGPNGRWVWLFELTGVDALDRATFIRKYLLPRYGELSVKEQSGALKWLRDHLSVAEGELEAGGDAGLREEVATAPLVRCTDGELHPAAALHDPSSDVIRDLFGDRSVYPDLTQYGSPKQWLGFFRLLGMVDKPRAGDLLAHVDRLSERARRGVTQRLTQQLVAVFLHLEERWSELREQPVEDEAGTLRAALQGRAWLPAERSGSSLHRWPAAAKPEDRLFRADELYLVGDANLVASQAPVFAAPRVSASLRRDLGFVTKPPLETVLAHFDAVIEYWRKGGAWMNPERFSGAVDDIYKFLAGFQGTLDAEVIGARYAGRPCLWHDGDFWPPERAFRAKVSFFGGRRVQVLVRPPIRHAYHMLGLRDKPVAEDFLAHLSELEAEASGSPLPPREVLHVLQLYPHLVGLLGTAASDTRFPLLTHDGRLVDAEDGFLPDAPWYADRVTPGTISLLHSDLPPEVKVLPWVRSLARDVSERATGRWAATADDRTKERIATFQSLIRTEPFRLGIARLVWNETGRHRASEVGWLARSKVVGVDSFESELVVTVRGEELLVGQGPSTQYFDADSKTFFVKVTLPSVVRQRLAQALNESLGEAKLRNAAPLLAILECEPEEVDRTLTELRVRPVDVVPEQAPPYELEVPADDEPSADATAPEANDGYSDAEPGVEADETAEASAPTPDTSLPADVAPTDDWASAPRPGQNRAGGRRLRLSDGDTVPDVNTNGQPAQRPAAAPGGTPQPGTPPRPRSQPTADPPQPGGGHRGATPTPPAPGRQPASDRVGMRPDRRTGGRRGRRRDRAVTYVAGALQSDGTVAKQELTQEERQRNIALGRAAVEVVCGFEQARGRHATPLGQTHPGYDINSTDPRVESTDPAGAIRHIEVKGFPGPWDQMGVAISARQYQAARELGDRFWLYVVEWADDPARAVVHPIRNPFAKITAYFFDRGWRQLADAADAPSAQGRVQPGDRLTVAGKGEGTVSEIQQRGALRVLKVLMDDGQTLTRAFNAATMFVLPARQE